LDQYPYGCSEQTLSTLLPLIYLGDVAKAYGVATRSDTNRQRIAQGVARVMARQSSSGAIGLWSSTDEDDPWLAAFAYDVLTRISTSGHYVPQAGLAHLRRYLSSVAAGNSNADGPAQAYSLYALARTGHANGSDVRYFAQTKPATTRLMAAHMGAALASISEPKRAQVFFTRADQIRRNVDYWRDYGSDVRDQAAQLALMAESSATPARLFAAAEAIDRVYGGKSEFASTQEAAWLLVATHKLAAQNRAPIKLRLPGGGDFGPSDAAYYRRLDITSLLNRAQFSNIGQGNIRAITTVRGAPRAPLAAVTNGFALQRQVFSLNGLAGNLANARQNQRFVVLLQGVVQQRGLGHPLVVDLLPAGFEIENAAVGAQDVGDQLKWLPPLSATRYTEARDDRFVAALAGSDDGLTLGTSFAVAYVARAITPGTFIYPGALVEDMYRPQYFSRTAPERVSVLKP
jgi:alpha-2-macroglobulin